MFESHVKTTKTYRRDRPRVRLDSPAFLQYGCSVTVSSRDLPPEIFLV